MNPTYAVIIVAVSNDLPQDRPIARPSANDALRHLNVMATLEISKTLGLQTVLVSNEPSAQSSTSLESVLTIAPPISRTIDGSQANLAASLIAGIEACPQADGWLILPTYLAAPSINTVKLVCDELSQYPLVYPACKGNRGTPIGFSKELYSELMQLRNTHDLRRLMSRYPSKEIPVDIQTSPIDDWLIATCAQSLQQGPFTAH